MHLIKNEAQVESARAALRNAEINLACRALQVFRPHKLNVAALGNLVPQLHVHVIARFENDIAWPRPVWGTATAKPYPLESLIERIKRLQAALAVGDAELDSCAGFDRRVCGQGRGVQKDVLAIIAGDEAEPLLVVVEPDLAGGHGRTSLCVVPK